MFIQSECQIYKVQFKFQIFEILLDKTQREPYKIQRIGDLIRISRLQNPISIFQCLRSKIQIIKART